MTFVQKAPVAGNPIASQDPSYIEQMLKAQRAQQLANALMEQSSQPIQYDQRGAVSWTQGLAKMLEAYVSRKTGENADKLTAGAMTAGNKSVANKFFGQTPEAGDASQLPSVPTVPDAGACRATPGGPQISSSTDAGAPVPSAPSNPPSPQAIGAVLAKSVEPPHAGAGNKPMADALLRFGGNGAGTSQSGGSLVMPGLTPQQSYDAYVTDPTAYMTEFVKRSDNRTDLDKLLLQNGVQPGSQEWTSAHQDAIRKNNYIPPVEVKAGTLSLDPTSRKPIAYNPGSEDGINLDFSNPLRPTAVPVNGYADQLGNIETAKRRAINSQTIAPTDNQPRTADGQVSNVTVDEIINPRRPFGGTRQPAVWTGGSLSDQQLQKAQQAARAGNRDAQEMLEAYSRSVHGQQSPSAPSNRPAGGLAFGQQQLAEDNAKTWTSQKQRASQVPGTLSVLGTMDQLLDGFTPGAGADNLAKWKSFASTHGIPIDLKATDAAQEFNKYANQLIAQQRSAMGGTATDAAQAVAQAGSANWGIGKDPNRNILQYLKANEMGVDKFTNAKATYLSQAGNGMHNASDFDRQWNSVYDPRIIMFQNMAPAQKSQFTAELVKSNQYDEFERKLIGYKNLLKRYGQ